MAEEPRLLTRRVAEPGPSVFERINPTPATPPPARPRQAARRRAPRPPSRILRRLFLSAIFLAFVAAIGFGIAALWLRHAMRASLPQIDGTLHVAGLSAPVTVTRNAQGVPSIHAVTMDDLLFAQGFVTAQDRLWQMDMLRRHAAGDLAEILGPGFVAHDRQQRYLQLRAAADRATQSLPPEQLHELQAYARGVNAFIDSHRDRLPVEFHLLHYQPRAWSPRDSILVELVMWQDLSTSFPQKLDREAFAQHLPTALLADLYPVGSWRDRPPTQPPADLTAPHIVQQIPLDATQSKLETPRAPLPTATPHDLLAISESLSQRSCSDCRAGSNNWVVAGSHSASGAPLISNDMHLSLTAPDIWYEASLHTNATPGSDSPLDVAGFTLPGVPWVLVGRNAHVAWTFTNLGGDVQDLWVEHLRGEGSTTEFERPDGSWSPVQHHVEHIAVRAGRDVSLDVLTTAHTIGATTIETPIISPLYPSEHRALSLSWTVYDPGALTASMLSADAAPDAASLVAAFAGFGGPSLNMICADDHGHIGYHAIGKIPIRGPAVQHPRAVPQFVIPGPEPDSDENDDNEESQSTTGSDSAPVATPAVFSPSAAPSSPEPNPLWHQAAYVPSRRYRRRARVRPQRVAPSAALPLTQQTVAPVPLDQNFTIGSPLSPVPIDALNANEAWSGYIPFDQLPAIQDPASGILATANSRVSSDSYPYALALNWIDPYRTERIYHLLEGRNNLTPQAMLSIQSDQHSEFDLLLAQRVAYAIDRASSAARGHDTARLRQAADLLRNWQGNDTVDSPAAAIVAAIRDQLWPSLLLPQIIAHDHCSRSKAERLAQLYSWGERTSALEEMLNHDPARWLPHGVPNWDDFLTEITDRSLKSADAPHDLSHWRYGSGHTVAIEHPLFGGSALFRRLLGTANGTGSQPVGGDTTTIDSVEHAFGPSERFTADLSNPSATLSNITTGESGNPASPWFLDQFTPWLNVSTFRMPLNEAGAEHTLTLLPAS